MVAITTVIISVTNLIGIRITTGTDLGDTDMVIVGGIILIGTLTILLTIGIQDIM